MRIMIKNIKKLFTEASKIWIYSVKISKCKIFDTMKPLYSGHHLDLEKMSATYKFVPNWLVLPRKPSLGVLGYDMMKTTSNSA